MAKCNPNSPPLMLLKRKLTFLRWKNLKIHHFLGILSFSFCLSNLVYQLWYILEGYIHNRFSSRLSYKSQHQIELPYIRVCSSGWPNQTAIDQNNISPDLFNYMLDFFHDGYFSSTHLPKKKAAKVEKMYRTLMQRSDYKIPKLFRKITVKCDYLIRNCLAGGKTMQCCAVNATRVQITERGICYLLNYHEPPQPAPIQQRKGGPSGGFIFHFVEDSATLNIYRKTPTFQGLMLSTVEENLGNVLFESDPVAIPPRSLAMVQLELTITKLRTGCKNYAGTQPSDPKMMTETGTEGCQKRIQLDLIERHCKCGPYNFISQHWQKSYCTPSDYKKCVYPLMLVLENNMSTTACTQECENHEFTQRLSYSKFNDHVYKKLYAPDLNSSRYSVTEVHLFMAQSGYMFIEEVEMQSWHMLVANFGGQLGLWLGFSVLGTAGLVVKLAKYVCATKNYREQNEKPKAVNKTHQEPNQK